MEIELYVGDGTAAYARVERDERALRRSLLLTVQHMRVQTAFLRGRAAIASIASIADEPALRTVRVDVTLHATLPYGKDGRLRGRLYFHLGDDSSFVAKKRKA